MILALALALALIQMVVVLVLLLMASAIPMKKPTRGNASVVPITRLATSPAM
jgi:hypothetical protein